MPDLDDLNAETVLLERNCPHCDQPAGPRGLAHWKPEWETLPGSTLRRKHVHCPRAPRRAGREYWSFACPPNHRCYRVPLRRLPLIPGTPAADVDDPEV
jgi:hypothetical protein